jgi:hypothetical protein
MIRGHIQKSKTGWESNSWSPSAMLTQAMLISKWMNLSTVTIHTWIINLLASVRMTIIKWLINTFLEMSKAVQLQFAVSFVLLWLQFPYGQTNFDLILWHLQAYIWTNVLCRSQTCSLKLHFYKIQLIKSFPCNFVFSWYVFFKAEFKSSITSSMW